MPLVTTKTNNNKSEYKLLKDLYIKQGKSAEEIAGVMKVSLRTVWLRLKYHRISKTKDIKPRKYCKSCGHAL
jgi:hypothetical protein